MTNPHSEFRESWLNRLQSTWGMGLAFSLGVEDGLSINTLALTVLFCFFLVYVVRTRLNVFFCGILCMIVQFVALALLVHGRFDSLLSQEDVYRYVRIFCGILGLIFGVVGLIYFRDWWHLRRASEENPWIVLPKTVDKKDNSESLFIVNLFVSLFYWILSVLFGGAIVFLSSYAIQDYTMFMMLIDSISKEEMQSGEKAILVYAGAYLIPCVLIWFFTVLYSFNGRFRAIIERKIAIVKIMLSAVFLGFGIGLLITFYAM